MNETLYDLNINSVGVIDKEQMPSFNPVVVGTLPTDLGRLGTRDLVIHAAAGMVYISTNVANYLVDARYLTPVGKLGRVKLFRWTGELEEQALERCAYPDRNGREAWVSERNLNIIAWLDELNRGKFFKQ